MFRLASYHGTNDCFAPGAKLALHVRVSDLKLHNLVLAKTGKEGTSDKGISTEWTNILITLAWLVSVLAKDEESVRACFHACDTRPKYVHRPLPLRQQPGNIVMLTRLKNILPPIIGDTPRHGKRGGGAKKIGRKTASRSETDTPKGWKIIE